jgi:periplasmic divalent cation tolerance protein
VSAVVVITTVGTEEQADRIARELLRRRQAACVNLVPGLRSLYRWQGRICRDTELLLLIKTHDDELDAVAATIRELHSYELPEILAFPVAWGEPQFLAWIAASLDKESPAPDAEPPLGPPVAGGKH